MIPIRLAVCGGQPVILDSLGQPHDRAALLRAIACLEQAYLRVLADPTPAAATLRAYLGPAIRHRYVMLHLVERSQVAPVGE